MPGAASLRSTGNMLGAKRSRAGISWAVGKKLRCFDHLSSIFEHDQVGEMAKSEDPPTILDRDTGQDLRNSDSEGADSSSTTVLEHQECKTIHYESFWIVGAIWIVMPLQFSSFQFLAWRMDLLRKHKGIIPLRPFLQLDHARKSSSGGQNPSDFFLRLRICPVLNALPTG